MLQSSSMPQMNPDQIMDLIQQSNGITPEQDNAIDAATGVDQSTDDDSGMQPPMGADPSMMQPQSTGDYDSGEAMSLLQQLNLPQEAIDQLLWHQSVIHVHIRRARAKLHGYISCCGKAGGKHGAFAAVAWAYDSAADDAADAAIPISANGSKHDGSTCATNATSRNDATTSTNVTSGRTS